MHCVFKLSLAKLAQLSEFWLNLDELTSYTSFRYFRIHGSFTSVGNVASYRDISCWDAMNDDVLGLVFQLLRNDPLGCSTKSAFELQPGLLTGETDGLLYCLCSEEKVSEVVI